MEIVDRFRKSLGTKEKKPEFINAESFDEFKRILEKEAAGVVCIHPYRIVRQSEEQGQYREYGLDYYSQSLSGTGINFSETLGTSTMEEDLQLKNIVTAIGRTKLLNELLHIDSYVTTKGGYLAEALDPAGYGKIVEDAKTKAIEPWPTPIPQVFTDSLG